MKIDWKARISNKIWWLTVIPIIIMIAEYFGLDLTIYIGKDWTSLVNLIFTLLALLGVTVDTSTPGISDIKPRNEIDESINDSKDNK